MRRSRHGLIMVSALMMSLISVAIESIVIQQRLWNSETIHASAVVPDPLGDLVHIYTGEPAENYSDFVDVQLTELQLSTEANEISCNITLAGEPAGGIENTVFYTILLDENNDRLDNSPEYPLEDSDTMYTVIRTESGNWTIERAKYQVIGRWWIVEDTEAVFTLNSSEQGNFTVHMRVPLAELNFTGLIPWKVKTETFTFPSTFPATGDFVPNQGLAYLPDLPPQPVIYNPRNGSWVSGLTGVSAAEMSDAKDVVSTLFEYSQDGETWNIIRLDTDGRANTFPREVYDPSWDGWGALWNTSDMPEAWYDIKATMTDLTGQWRSTQTTVYVDPTPPYPVIVEPAFDQMVQDTVRIKIFTEDEDVAGVIFSAFRVYTSSDYEKDVPFPPQGYGCAPAAVAASLLWLDDYKNEKGDEPFDDLVPPGLEGQDGKKLCEKLNKDYFKTTNKDPMGQVGEHATSDKNVMKGIADYLNDRNKAGMKQKFTVKAIKANPQDKNAIWPDTLPPNINWVQYYKTMLPHEDITLFLDGEKQNGDDWGHSVTANSFRSSLEIDWTMDGCVWAQIPPWKIDFMDHNGDTYREVEVDEHGNVKGLENYYPNLKPGGQSADMIVISPEATYSELEKALEEWQKLPSDWMPLGHGTPLPRDPYEAHLYPYSFPWDTTTVEDGHYLLMATIVDDMGNEASSMIWITVNNNQSMVAPGDVNGDRRVDVYDIVLGTISYGCTEQCPKWNPCTGPLADCAPPWGIIDLYDLVMIGAHYSKEYP